MSKRGRPTDEAAKAKRKTERSRRGVWLRCQRTEILGWTQQRLADELGVSKARVSAWELGVRLLHDDMKAKVAQAVATFF